MYKVCSKETKYIATAKASMMKDLECLYTHLEEGYEAEDPSADILAAIIDLNNVKMRLQLLQ